MCYNCQRKFQKRNYNNSFGGKKSVIEISTDDWFEGSNYVEV